MFEAELVRCSVAGEPCRAAAATPTFRCGRVFDKWHDLAIGAHATPRDQAYVPLAVLAGCVQLLRVGPTIELGRPA
jgi:hypothetical protein